MYRWQPEALAEGRLSRKYGDDDLMVGSINPFQLFLIYVELVGAEQDSSDPTAQQCAREVAYMIDQAHNIELKIPALIRSVMNLQEAYARALLVDRDRLRRAQEVGEVLEAHETILDAYSTDVRPLLAHVREEIGLNPDPLRAYRESGYQEKIAGERPAGSGKGWE